MRYIPVGGETIQDKILPRFDCTELPVFEPSTGLYAMELGHLRPVGGSNYPAVRQYHSTEYGDWGRTWSMSDLRYQLSGTKTAEPKSLPSIRTLAFVGRSLRVDSGLEHTRAPEVEQSMLEDSEAIQGIADRTLERHTALELSIARSILRRLTPGEVAVGAQPTSEHHVYPGIRLGILTGLAMVEVPKPHDSFAPARAGLEPVVMHPTSGDIGLFPKNMTVLGALYTARTLRESLRLPAHTS